MSNTVVSTYCMLNNCLSVITLHEDEHIRAKRGRAAWNGKKNSEFQDIGPFCHRLNDLEQVFLTFIGSGSPLENTAGDLSIPIQLWHNYKTSVGFGKIKEGK